jgi:hypothetical protein
VLLGHTKIEKAIRHLGVAVDGALQLAEQSELEQETRADGSALSQKRSLLESNRTVELGAIC